MRRTKLVVDEQLLAKATRVLAARTYSAAVNTALEEVIRLHKIRGIPRVFQSGIWDGDLAEMLGVDRTPFGPAEANDPGNAARVVQVLRWVPHCRHRD